MKYLVFLFAILSVSIAAPTTLDDDSVVARASHSVAHIVRYFYDHRGLDGYKFT